MIRIPKATGKGKNAREIPLWALPMAEGVLREWKVERKGQGAKAGDHFVCSQASHAFGKRLDRRNARSRFLACCKILGEERQRMLTVHDGRHSCASHLLAAGWPLPMVRDMLGHASVATTSVCSHVVVDDEVPPDPFAFANGKAAR